MADVNVHPNAQKFISDHGGAQITKMHQAQGLKKGRQSKKQPTAHPDNRNKLKPILLIVLALVIFSTIVTVLMLNMPKSTQMIHDIVDSIIHFFQQFLPKTYPQ